MSSNARLYDDLDFLYRELWGTSLHHGLWIDGQESPKQARDQLAQTCLSALNPQPGESIADIGCGYGTFSHRLVEKTDCQVRAFTNSRAQIQSAKPHPNITFHHQDWLHHRLPPGSLDKAIALESLSHFPEFDTFLSATTRSLKSHATLVIADWFAAPDCSPLEMLLLNHLAKTGAIPPWRTLDKLLIAAAHLTLKTHQNLSAQAAPTWTAFSKSALLVPLKKTTLIPRLLKTALRRPSLLTTFPLLSLAYHLGLLEYHLCTFENARHPPMKPCS